MTVSNTLTYIVDMEKGELKGESTGKGTLPSLGVFKKK